MSEEEQQLEENEIIGPGRMLKEARLKAGITPEEVAARLHLRVNNIVDIENDNYDEDISLTFTKGYLKLYAKQIKLPVETVMEAFEKYNTKQKEPAKLQSFSRRVAQQANDDRLMLITYLVLAVVIALVVIWWFQQSDKPTTSTNTNVSLSSVVNEIQNAPDAQLVKDALQSQDPITSGGDEADSLQTTATRLDADTEEPLSADVSQIIKTTEPLDAQPYQQAPILADPAELVFEFADDCWMNLTDATGEVIAYGVKVKGRVMTVSGVPPFQVTLGAPEVVQISYAGEAVDMTVFKPGNTAKFNLPQQQAE
jgi:cytoskeleton protein RodZ